MDRTFLWGVRNVFFIIHSGTNRDWQALIKVWLLEVLWNPKGTAPLSVEHHNSPYSAGNFITLRWDVEKLVEDFPTVNAKFYDHPTSDTAQSPCQPNIITKVVVDALLTLDVPLNKCPIWTMNICNKPLIVPVQHLVSEVSGPLCLSESRSVHFRRILGLS